jgi:hypothetical protein
VATTGGIDRIDQAGRQLHPSNGSTPSQPGHSHGRAKTQRPQGDPRPLGGYGAILGTYTVAAGALVVGLRRRKSDIRKLSWKDLVLLGLATEHLSRLVTKDSLTSPFRAPFTEFEESAGEGEVNEEVVGTGLRQAVGELLTCPFCVAQWVATTLVAGDLVAPQLTTAAVSVCAAARVSDYLQLTYGLLRKRQ